MTTPWMPAGSPKRKSWRMMPQSGASGVPRPMATTHLPDRSSQIRYALTIMADRTLAMAAPAVPKEGIGPRPGIRITLRVMLRSVSTTPRRSGVRASPAARSAPPAMKNIIMPKQNTRRMRR